MQDETIPKTKHKTIALGFKNSSCSLTLLISVFLFYKTHLWRRPLLAENTAQKHAFILNFQLFRFNFTSFFREKSPKSTILPFCLVTSTKFLVAPKTAFISQKIGLLSCYCSQ